METSSTSASTSSVTSCPRCGRTVPAARGSCLYCGAALPAPETPLGALETEAEAPAVASDRVLIVVRISPDMTEALSGALGMTQVEAVQLLKKGEFHLLRIASPAEAHAETERLTAAGLSVLQVPEAEVLASPPRLVLGGTMAREGLRLRTEAGEAQLAAAEILLLVQGPIARHYQTAPDMKRVRTATLEEGYRVHLHLKAQARPLEIDPGGFEFSLANPGRSSLLAIREWTQGLGGTVPIDDSFRRFTPALGLAAGKTAGRLGAVESLASSRTSSDEGAVILDNLVQFRFYSSWRAAVERRRR